MNDIYGPGLFYVGLSLVLLNVNYVWLRDSVPDALSQFRFFLSQIGKALLYLRLAFMFVRHPRFVFCFALLRLFLVFTLAAGGDYFINILILVLAASRDTDIRVNLRIYFGAFIFFLLSSFLCYSFGWADDITRQRWSMTGHSYGMVNPAILSVVLLMLSIYIVLSVRVKERPVVALSVFCVFMSIFVFFLTLRLTETIVLLMIPVFYVAFLNRPSLSRWLPFVPVAFLLLSVLIAAHCPPGEDTTTFESRFSTARMVFERDGLTLFGQDCGIVSLRTAWKYNIPPFTIDNGYLRLFLRNGLLLGSFVMALWSFLFHRISKMCNPLLASIAVAMAIEGMMESWVFGVYYNFVLLFLFHRFTSFSARCGRLAVRTALVATAAALLWLYAPWGAHPAYSSTGGCVGDIVPPRGFERVDGTDAAYTQFVRRLPLSSPDSVLRHFDGTPNDSLQPYCYRTIQLPLLSKNEQCADVCMRLRAEYLLSSRQFFRIRFADTQKRVLRYVYGYNRGAMYEYLKDVFKTANTESMNHSMPVRALKDIQPGDVFLYDAKSRPSSRYGHAMFVADVAVNETTGQRAFLLMEGSTPASTIHLVKNLARPDLSPWFLLDTASVNNKPAAPAALSAPATLDFGVARYYSDELHRFE
ncbi:MAG: hypothetical protein J5506_06145 [Prevotella sp.]|nr:hypothetical protein [Prevotella sp.]